VPGTVSDQNPDFGMNSAPQAVSSRSIHPAYRGSVPVRRSSVASSAPIAPIPRPAVAYQNALPRTSASPGSASIDPTTPAATMPLTARGKRIGVSEMWMSAITITATPTTGRTG